MKARPDHIIVAVDRIEGSTVLLESDGGERFTLAAKDLPPHPREGAIYRVPVDRSGKPVWASAVADPVEEAKRKADLAQRMGALRKRDRGGDIEL